MILPPHLAPQPQAPDETANPSILEYTPHHVELTAKLDQPGLVILADSYEENWVCEVTDLKTGQMRREPILRTNRVMRGVWLPAGDYKLVFRYRPLSFYWGAALSGVGWLNVLILLVCDWAARQRRASLPVG